MPSAEHSTPLANFSSQRWQYLALACITALAAFLRLWQAGESLWIDELHTSWVVNGSWRDVLPRAAMGNQSPLYFWGMWLLVQVTGQSEWTLRMPSLIAGIALPAAVWLLVGQVSNLPKTVSGQVGGLSYVALAAALLVAIDPVCIFYAQEARPYAWVMLLAVAELVLLKRLIERPTVVARMALLANSLLLFYLHYTTIFFLAGIVVMLPVLVRLTGSPYRTKWLVLDLLLAAALAAPGTIQMADIFERRTNWEAFVREATWERLVFEVPFAAWAMAGAVVVLIASRFSPRRVPRDSLWYCVLFSSVFVPLTLSWSITALDAARIFHVRYLVALIPLSAAAACLATAWIPWRAIQLTALAALTGWHLYDGRMIEQFASDGRFLEPRDEDWRGAVDYINRQLMNTKNVRLVLDAGLIESPGSGTSNEESEYQRFALSGLYRVEADRGAFLPVPPSHIRDLFDVGRMYFAFHARSSPEKMCVIVRGSSKGATNRFVSYLNTWESLDQSDPRPTFAKKARRSFGRVHVFQLDVTYEPNPDALIKWRSRDGSSD